ncbi:MAG: ABC transporter permease, partial [Gemmatimonadales bacterium]
MSRLIWASVAVILGLAALAAGLTAAGYDSGSALAALWSGAFGSWYAFSSSTLVRSVPLILIGLGIAIAFRGGALNIGAEGQFYAGAIAATWVGMHVAGRPSIVAIAALLSAAALAGAAWIAIPVWLKLRF